MRELRSSTVSAREKTNVADTDGKKKPESATTSKTEQGASDAKSGKAGAKGWKTRGRIKPTAVSKTAPEEPEEQSLEKQEPDEEPTEEIEVEPKAETVVEKMQLEKKEGDGLNEESVDPLEEKEGSYDKENKAAGTSDEIKEESTDKPGSSPSKSAKRKVVDVALEEEAEEDSANESKQSPDSVPSKKSRGKGGQPKKRRPVYDKDLVEKAVNEVLEGNLTGKAAAEKYEVSRHVVRRRVSEIRGVSSTPGKKRHGDAEVHVIRVEDLD